MRALSSIGLVLSACSLAAFFWPESKLLAASFLAWLYVVLGDVARAVEQRGDLAAGGGELGLGLALAVDRGVDDRSPSFLVGRDGLALEVLRASRSGPRRVFSYSESAVVSRGSPLSFDLRLGIGPLGDQAEDLAQHGPLALEDRRLGWRRMPAPGLAFASGTRIVRRPVVVVLTMTHSGRNNRGGPGRAPRRSSACR